MARVSTYLNFMGRTEEAFNSYREVFGTQFSAPFQYMRDVPLAPGQPELPENEKGMVMHVALPILGGHEIHGTDMLASMGHELTVGNNVTINLEPDTRADTDRLFAALSAGGDPEQRMPLQEMFWGGYFGVCLDRHGVRWMFNCTEPRA